MAKKTLKSALRAHEVRKAQAANARKVEEAAQRKATSIKGGKGGGGRARARKKTAVVGKGQQAASTLGGGKKPEESLSAAVAPQRRQNKAKAFEQDDTILLVGEGNFSFARSLLLPPHSLPPSRILATAFDTEQQCYSKYPDAAQHVQEMRSIAGRDSIVAFGVDAGDLLQHKSVRIASTSLNPHASPASWSKIVFNFPHVGAGHKDEARNTLANQLLLLRFLICASVLLSSGRIPHYVQSSVTGMARRAQGAADESEDVIGGDSLTATHDSLDEDRAAQSDMLDDDDETARFGSEEPREAVARTPNRAGSVLITLRNCKPYTMWDVPRLAKRMSSEWHGIVSQAPSPARGQRTPTSEDVEAVLRLGQGRAYRVWRSFAFQPDDWPGYEHRRTIGWREGFSTTNNADITRVTTTEKGECRTWQLGLTG